MMVRIPHAKVFNINYCIIKINSECNYSCLTSNSYGCLTCSNDSNRNFRT